MGAGNAATAVLIAACSLNDRADTGVIRGESEHRAVVPLAAAEQNHIDTSGVLTTAPGIVLDDRSRAGTTALQAAKISGHQNNTDFGWGEAVGGGRVVP